MELKVGNFYRSKKTNKIVQLLKIILDSVIVEMQDYLPNRPTVFELSKAEFIREYVPHKGIPKKATIFSELVEKKLQEPPIQKFREEKSEIPISRPRKYVAFSNLLTFLQSRFKSKDEIIKDVDPLQQEKVLENYRFERGPREDQKLYGVSVKDLEDLKVIIEENTGENKPFTTVEKNEMFELLDNIIKKKGNFTLSSFYKYIITKIELSSGEEVRKRSDVSKDTSFPFEEVPKIVIPVSSGIRGFPGMRVYRKGFYEPYIILNSQGLLVSEEELKENGIATPIQEDLKNIEIGRVYRVSLNEIVEDPVFGKGKVVDIYRAASDGVVSVLFENGKLDTNYPITKFPRKDFTPIFPIKENIIQCKLSQDIVLESFCKECPNFSPLKDRCDYAPKIVEKSVEESVEKSQEKSIKKQSWNKESSWDIKVDKKLTDVLRQASVDDLLTVYEKIDDNILKPGDLVRLAKDHTKVGNVLYKPNGSDCYFVKIEGKVQPYWKIELEKIVEKSIKND